MRKKETNSNLLTKPTILHALCSLLLDEKMLLYLESWEVASLKFPKGETPMGVFLSPALDLPISLGSMVGRLDD